MNKAKKSIWVIPGQKPYVSSHPTPNVTPRLGFRAPGRIAVGVSGLDLERLYRFWYFTFPFGYCFGKKNYQWQKSDFWRRGRPKNYAYRGSCFFPFVWLLHRYEEKMSVEELASFFQEFLSPMVFPNTMVFCHSMNKSGGLRRSLVEYFQEMRIDLALNSLSLPRIKKGTPLFLENLKLWAWFSMHFLSTPASRIFHPCPIRPLSKEERKQCLAISSILGHFYSYVPWTSRRCVWEKFWMAFSRDVLRFHEKSLLKTFGQRYHSLEKKWEDFYFFTSSSPHWVGEAKIKNKPQTKPRAPGSSPPKKEVLVQRRRRYNKKRNLKWALAQTRVPEMPSQDISPS